MKEFERIQAKQLLSSLNETPRFIQNFAGPRQVGKTTLVKQFLTHFTG